MRSLILLLLLLFSFTSYATNCTQEFSLFKRAQSLLDDKEYLLSAVHFSSLSLNTCDKRLGSRAQVGYAISLYNLGEKAQALKSLETSHFDFALEDRERVKLLQDFIVESDQNPQVKIWKLRRKTEDITGLLGSTNFSPSDKNQIASLHQEILDSRKKSPVTAGVLSALLPGSGQAYDGAWQSGVIALLLNGLFLAATFDFSRQNMYGAATASGLVFSITYIGNIINAVNTAHRVNDRESLEREEKYRDLIFPSLKAP